MEALPNVCRAEIPTAVLDLFGLDPPFVGELFEVAFCLAVVVVFLVSVPLMPSSPTVACRMSSKKVHNPSLKSDAICFPVLTSTSADGGGMDLRFAKFL